MNLQDLGDRIRHRRKKCGLTQTDVANAVQVSPQAVSKWERGENAPDIAILSPIAQLLGVSIEWLLGCHSIDKDVFEATVMDARARPAREKSERLTPRDFANWTNTLCYQITECVLRFGGIPVKARGAGILCFFSGNKHQDRAIDAALNTDQLVSEPLKIGQSTGDIYFGSIGHPDYAHPDIIGEAISIALLSSEWAEQNTKTGLAIDEKTLLASEKNPQELTQNRTPVNYPGISHPINIIELKSPSRSSS
ncbi:MAG: helix-turn-helix domain-containing protein [Verrucomicrobiota bacterium]